MVYCNYILLYTHSFSSAIRNGQNMLYRWCTTCLQLIFISMFRNWQSVLEKGSLHFMSFKEGALRKGFFNEINILVYIKSE